MHNNNFTDKVKDGFEKTGAKMKEGFEKAKELAEDAIDNVKEKFKEGGEKITDLKDDVIDAAQTPGEKLNEQLCNNLEGTDDEVKMKIQENMCKMHLDDKDNNEVIIEERLEEYTEILPNNKEDAA